MRVIEKPDYSSWTHVLTCKQCEAKLEIVLNDIKYTPPEYGVQWDPYYSAEHYSINCPICKKIAIIDKKHIPASALHLIKK